MEFVIYRDDQELPVREVLFRIFKSAYMWVQKFLTNIVSLDVIDHSTKFKDTRIVRFLLTEAIYV